MTGRGRAVALTGFGVVGVLALLVRVHWRLLTSWDARTDGSLHRALLRHASLVDAARWVTHLGDPAVVTVAAFVLAAVMARRRRAAVYVLVVRAVAAALSSAVKVAVGRSRPVLPRPFEHAGGGSFPSGHALGSAALWGSVAVLLWAANRRYAAVAVAVVVPVVVAATRVMLGVHFVSDVVAGLLCGWATAVGAGAVLTARRGGRGSPGRSPSMTPDRAR